MAETVTTIDPDDTPECRRYQVIIKTPLSEIRTLPEAELVARFDEYLALSHPPCNRPTLWQLGPDDYRDELNRRAANRQGRRLEVLTVVIAILTSCSWPLSSAGCEPSPRTDISSQKRIIGISRVG